MPYLTHKFLTRKLLSKKVNEIFLVNNIISYLGNECEKCGKIQEKPLTICIAWSKGNFKLEDIENNDYKLKKLCKRCTYSRCSRIQIYREIEDHLVYL